MADRPKVTVLVLSYNRPRMIRECLDSIKGADEVFILDDGSDFILNEVAKPFFNQWPRLVMRQLPKMTVEERLVTPRVGKAINQAIKDASGDGIAYLCDDDLFHPDWIENIRVHLIEAPAKPHFIYAQWNVFNDGEKPGDKVCNLVPFEMTTGNFAHRQDCPTRCNLWWSETSVACHDGFFVFWLQDKHPKWEVPKPQGVIAGWRREHPHNMVHFSNNAAYTDKAREVLSRGFLE